VEIDGILKKSLNASQYEAVTMINGLLLTITGAGTEKTGVIEYWVLYLVSKNISPYSMCENQWEPASYCDNKGGSRICQPTIFGNAL